MVERRREKRSRSLLGGRISFGGLHCTMDCVVRNLAPRGAMIAFPHTAITPLEFHLDIPHRGETHAARIIWRQHDRAGVALSDTEKHDVPVDATRRIRRLMAENRRLKRQLDPGSW